MLFPWLSYELDRSLNSIDKIVSNTENNSKLEQM